MKIGEETLYQAIKEAKIVNRIGEISEVIEKNITNNGYFIIKELTGHGIGKKLHEDPFVFGFVDKPIEKISFNCFDEKKFAKAINKKIVSNGDLSLAFNNGQKEKLPVMYLSNGKLSKKTEKFIEDNFKGYLIFRSL